MLPLTLKLYDRLHTNNRLANRVHRETSCAETTFHRVRCCASWIPQTHRTCKAHRSYLPGWHSMVIANAIALYNNTISAAKFCPTHWVTELIIRTVCIMLDSLQNCKAQSIMKRRKYNAGSIQWYTIIIIKITTTQWRSYSMEQMEQLLPPERQGPFM